MSKFIKAWELPDHKVAYEDEEGNIEVRSKGTPAWRNNNPGNLMAGPFANRHGAIGSAQGHAVFPDVEIAQKAKDALLKNNYADKTLEKAFKKGYSPEGVENPHVSDYVDFLSKRLKVPPNTKIGSLNDTQYNLLLTGIDIYEGSKLGEISQISFGTRENERLKKEWVMNQPLSKLEGKDIDLLIALPDYRNKAAPLYNKIHDLVRGWHELHHPPIPKRKPPGPVNVHGYPRKGGKNVKAHTRALPRNNKKGRIP